MKRAQLGTAALILGLCLTGVGPTGAGAQESTETGGPDKPAIAAPDSNLPHDPAIGAVTNMPLPRFVSLKGSEGNARRGPGLDNRIDWVFRHRDMPLMVTAEFGHWRRVEDRDGQGGWIHYTLLSGVRTVVITAEMAELHSSADATSTDVAKAENGVIGRLGACRPDWCRITAGGETGWVQKSEIWGVSADEIRE